MQVVGGPNGVAPIFASMQQTVDAAEGRSIAISAFERFDF
jgi:L-fucose mutarotase/ribose pyranase (RbsD/FucU family)